MAVLQLTDRGLPVPYITAWSQESSSIPPLVLRKRGTKSGIVFQDEQPHDRDWHGVLWPRCTLARGKGRAEFASVHALRQRQAASRLLCQICAAPTVEEDESSTLFVLRDVGRPVAEGELTTAPPVCAEHAATSPALCPRLREGHTAIRAQHVEPWGVAGIVYNPLTLAPQPPPPGYQLTEVAYDDPLIRFTVACRQVLALHGCTPVQLAA